MRQLISFLASGCFTGRLPLFPGTWGSVLGVLVYFLLSSLSPLSYGVTLTAFIFFAAWVSTLEQRYCGEQDPQHIVIDEVAGFLVTMAFQPHTWSLILAGFLLYRVFDVVKPFPCRWLERHFLSGWGVVLDDVMAGIYANAVLWIVGLILPSFGITW